MARVIIGTAGHIDHGKSTLVRALTGTDPDRLPEEKKRGITIDLGYAFLGDAAAIIDVPGHEKLIRNMVAGAATIDFALLVVAADDGVMPQTLEHLQILRLLGVQAGAVVLTKCDAVQQDWLDMVDDQVRSAVQGTFLAEAPIFRVDSVSGRGLDAFKDSLLHLITALPPRPDVGVFRLPVDRVFTVKGRGTVITGTIVSGCVEKEARLAVLPGGFDVRVKRLETHGSDSERLSAGQRAALNLVGDTGALARGMTLAAPGSLVVSQRIRIALDQLVDTEPIKHRQRLRFLIGTQETIGRAQIVGRDSSSNRTYANLLLEEPVVAAWGDHFVLRRYSPMETLGGGRVLDPLAPRLRSRDVELERQVSLDLDVDSRDQALADYLRHRAAGGLDAASLAAIFTWTPDELSAALQRLAGTNPVLHVAGRIFTVQRYQEVCAEIRAELHQLHERSPQSAAFSRGELRAQVSQAVPDFLLDHALQDLAASGTIILDGATVREPQRKATLNPAQEALYSAIRKSLASSGFTPPSSTMLAEQLNRPRPEIEKALVAMEKLGWCRRLGLDLFFDAPVFDRAISTLRDALRENAELTVAEAARRLESSRKFVVPFLEYLDSKGITARSGNVRVAGRNLNTP